MNERKAIINYQIDIVRQPTCNIAQMKDGLYLPYPLVQELGDRNMDFNRTLLFLIL